MTALLFKELAKFQQAMQGAKKDAKNPHFKTSYADLESVVSCVKEFSQGLNLSYTHLILKENDQNTLKTILAYSDGDKFECIESVLPLLTGKGGFNEMQALGSAITYAKRYTLQGLYGIPSEDDDAQSVTAVKKQEYSKPAPEKPLDDIYQEITEALSIDDLKIIAKKYSNHSKMQEKIKPALTTRKEYLAMPPEEQAIRTQEALYKPHTPTDGDLNVE